MPWEPGTSPKSQFTGSLQVEGKPGYSIERERFSRIKMLKVMFSMNKERIVKSLCGWSWHGFTSQKCGPRDHTFTFAEIIIFHLQGRLQVHGSGLHFNWFYTTTPYPLCHAGNIIAIKILFSKWMHAYKLCRGRHFLSSSEITASMNDYFHTEHSAVFFHVNALSLGDFLLCHGSLHAL